MAEHGRTYPKHVIGGKTTRRLHASVEYFNEIAVKPVENFTGLLRSYKTSLLILCTESKVTKGKDLNFLRD
ncbi:hypothetical protein E2986_12146 [Frieseomelitta varia]|uniref:Uncharacterized protein n=1 Tax=Frieseomelitta varia TaxID=561572 RepID=A0A833WAL5_9HYME|nr:hypothetical protein E2986_12146 [Frieseomelitta varia]